jgi:hypothetical protein
LIAGWPNCKNKKIPLSILNTAARLFNVISKAAVRPTFQAASFVKNIASTLRGAPSKAWTKASPTKGDTTMRFMVIVKANKDSEAGVMPSEELLAAMGKFNEELVKAGVMLAGEGLQPSSKGTRVKFSGAKRTVTDGPFAETKELIAGFWLWQCKSKQEAIEWVKRCPAPMGPGQDSEIEIRQVFEAADFGAEFTPELREQEKRLRNEIASKH